VLVKCTCFRFQIKVGDYRGVKDILTKCSKVCITNYILISFIRFISNSKTASRIPHSTPINGTKGSFWNAPMKPWKRRFGWKIRMGIYHRWNIAKNGKTVRQSESGTRMFLLWKKWVNYNLLCHWIWIYCMCNIRLKSIRSVLFGIPVSVAIPRFQMGKSRAMIWKSDASIKIY